jgi:hypothetical protein
MKKEVDKLIQENSKGAELLVLTIRGSRAYGTEIETSDTDYSGVYIQSIDDILGYGYKPQIKDEKGDIVLYEIGRFLELIGESKTNVLEQLNMPDGCIVYKHPIFNDVLDYKDVFITKQCYLAFYHYAKTQLHKAKNLDKKTRWEKEKKQKSGIMDFCYVIDGSKSYPLKDKLEEFNISQENCGVVNVPNARGVYALYHGESINYKGIVSSGENESNQLRLSSVPKGEECVFNFHYNKDGYIKHCKEYKSYTDWLKKRNTERYVVTETGEIEDAKNMMHCCRLVDMSREIAQGLGVVIKRPNREELLDIRKGKVPLQKLIDKVESDLQEIEILFESSGLPDKIEDGLVEKITVSIRKKFYKI